MKAKRAGGRGGGGGRGSGGATPRGGGAEDDASGGGGGGHAEDETVLTGAPSGSGREIDFGFERTEALTGRRRKAENAKTQAVISASAKLRYGAVMRLIDAIRMDGVERYALNIEADAELNPEAP